MKYGLMQIAEGLSFLHKDVKLLHGNLCPESVIINASGAWKIAGFELFVTNNNDPNDAVGIFNNNFNFQQKLSFKTNRILLI